MRSLATAPLNANSNNGNQTPSSHQNAGDNLFPRNPGIDELQANGVDFWNDSQWAETLAYDQGLLSDSMYGLFTADDPYM